MNFAPFFFLCVCVFDAFEWKQGSRTLYSKQNAKIYVYQRNIFIYRRGTSFQAEPEVHVRHVGFVHQLSEEHDYVARQRDERLDTLKTEGVAQVEAERQRILATTVEAVLPWNGKNLPY